MSEIASPVAPRARTWPWGDALVVIVATAITIIACATFDLAETLRRLTASWERLQLDELPVVLLVLAAGLAWFAARRYREADREIASRRAVEARLALVLADNRRLAQQYLQAQESERKALARELHDELGQYLNVIKLDAVRIRDDRQQLSSSALRECSSAIVENCDHVHRALSALLRRLRPVGLDELGLVAALEHCVETWRARLPAVSLRLIIPEKPVALSEDIALTLYRLAQEALTNIARHSAARHVTIDLEQAASSSQSGEEIRLAVTDDGVGADLSLPTGGLGLIGMRERVLASGGLLTLRSEPGRGFALEARIPLQSEC